ncbi:HDOD domain-containing protein [Caldimonas thermodepolymerans]|uniref:Histidine kinase n=1 Tax=Caldimonas thermodepolymerans TaxID=215580 RepID=A0A2S5TA33_9BURK|nr:HDOD domain-containing protein [Caldimonas thermodepolymerans]PPE71727.1 histidine kinase [Caldimonas thermodepolymerans]QPC30753.1 HDOD domain-containing protein [Caldimonas thermodepolymerans]RDI02628.1 EAL and modified HD-GYP domain-containing signal transduction protein [Caldimonas thermodepolymerans]
MDNNVLRNIALSYSPMIDRQRSVVATRLTVSALRTGVPMQADQLLAAIAEVWPEGGARVSLNIMSETLLNDLLRATPLSNVMIEIPSFIACDPANTQALLSLRGTTLLLHGRPTSTLPRELLPCFKYSIIDLADDRRRNEVPGQAATRPARSVGFIQSGVRTVSEMEASFARGAVAILGWPIEDVVTQSGSRAGQPDLAVLVELIRRVDDGDDVDKLDAVLKRDPALAFQLMRYINSPAFGLSVEISSFRHAIMLLGYKRLKRWLALLLATASKDVNMRPVMYASVRRGLLMEQLIANTGDEEIRGEVFICGVFSLLDRLFNKPFHELLQTIPVPERVYQALVEGTGPYHPYLELTKAVETETAPVINELAEGLLMSLLEVNRAVLGTLTMAAQLE